MAKKKTKGLVKGKDYWGKPSFDYNGSTLAETWKPVQTWKKFGKFGVKDVFVRVTFEKDG